MVLQVVSELVEHAVYLRNLLKSLEVEVHAGLIIAVCEIGVGHDEVLGLRSYSPVVREGIGEVQNVLHALLEGLRIGVVSAVRDSLV